MDGDNLCAAPLHAEGHDASRLATKLAQSPGELMNGFLQLPVGNDGSLAANALRDDECHLVRSFQSFLKKELVDETLLRVIGFGANTLRVE